MRIKMGPSILTPKQGLDIQDETVRCQGVKGSNTGTWKWFSRMMNLVEDGDTVRVHVWKNEMMFYMCKDADAEMPVMSRFKYLHMIKCHEISNGAEQNSLPLHLFLQYFKYCTLKALLHHCCLWVSSLSKINVLQWWGSHSSLGSLMIQIMESNLSFPSDVINKCFFCKYLSQCVFHQRCSVGIFTIKVDEDWVSWHVYITTYCF